MIMSCRSGGFGLPGLAKNSRTGVPVASWMLFSCDRKRCGPASRIPNAQEQLVEFGIGQR
jgi:hypothetical protein